ncbi:MAG: type II secretion system inner membrane protein GspF [Xanthomonadales bacterium]|nr:type II secretion system inner membrane protein GspF [Xanthomonadales bacterium]
MPAFEYKALNAAGNKEHGLLEGDSERQIRQQLRDKGWMPLEVVAVREKAALKSKTLGGIFRRGQRLNAATLTLITRQLATLISAGTPVESALQSVARQSTQRGQSRVLLAVRAKVLEGHQLATGLGEFPQTFSQLYRATVFAGEQAGKLDHVLERLSDYLETRNRVQQKTSLALIYPVVLSVVAIGVVIALLTYVVPKVVQVFESTGQQLPALTRGLIASSEFIQTYGLFLLVSFGIVFLATRLLLNNPVWQKRWHVFLLRIPMISGLIKGMETARFTRTMSILLGSGVPALESLTIVKQVIHNQAMIEAVDITGQRVKEGASISLSLANTRLFPPLTLELIRNGEVSGQLPEMMERAAVNQEQEIETKTATALGLFEPLLILAMGGIVLVIVLAILMPIFEMNQLVK